jgi:transcriptional regulator GlxA family with amidase domain
MAPTIPKALRIGVLIPEEVQLLDLACVDLLSMLSKDYLTKAKLPEALYNMGIPDLKIYYIAETARTQQDTTAGASIRITHSLDDDAVQPGCLDIILIPGPFLPPNTTDRVKNFAKMHQAHEHKDGQKTVFLIVCTGIFVAGNCGILDDKMVTGPRFMLFDLKAAFPRAQWNWSSRWVRDGNVWTCGTLSSSCIR